MFARRSVLLLFSVSGFAVPFIPAGAEAGPALDRIRDQGILVAAADPSWPPFSWRDPIGEYYGFDVEVARAIAERLGVRAEFVSPGWEAQVEGAWEGRWDVAVNSITPTEARRERLDFPAVYSTGVAVAAARSDSDAFDAPEELAAARIGVMEATLYQSYLEGADMGIAEQPDPAARIKAAEIVTFADSSAPYRLLEEGRVIDVVIDDLIAVKEQIARGRPIRIVGGPLFVAPSAVAIELGDPEFSAEIARIVEEMRADGTLDALHARWFDESARAAMTVAAQN
jgi:polar amino acid transport system substrate-binding protein